MATLSWMSNLGRTKQRLPNHQVLDTPFALDTSRSGRLLDAVARHSSAAGVAKKEALGAAVSS